MPRAYGYSYGEGVGPCLGRFAMATAMASLQGDGYAVGIWFGLRLGCRDMSRCMGMTVARAVI